MGRRWERPERRTPDQPGLAGRGFGRHRPPICWARARSAGRVDRSQRSGRHRVPSSVMVRVTFLVRGHDHRHLGRVRVAPLWPAPPQHPSKWRAAGTGTAVSSGPSGSPRGPPEPGGQLAGHVEMLRRRPRAGIPWAGSKMDWRSRVMTRPDPAPPGRSGRPPPAGREQARRALQRQARRETAAGPPCRAGWPRCGPGRPGCHLAQPLLHQGRCWRDRGSGPAGRARHRDHGGQRAQAIIGGSARPGSPCRASARPTALRPRAATLTTADSTAGPKSTVQMIGRAG